MCRPTYYTIAYEINPWMSVKRQTHRSRALRQWSQLYDTLTQKLQARVHLLPSRAGVPDLVFTANAGLVTERLPAAPTKALGLAAQAGTIIRSNFRFPERQREEPLVEAYFTQRGYRVVRLPRRYTFEGEGDALWMNDTLVFGFRFRSDAPTHEALARLLRARVLPVELADRRFYHLDTCFCPLDAHSALWFPKAFDRYGRKVLKGLVADPIAVSESDATRFVCNTIVLGSNIVMPSGASAHLRRALTRRGFRLYPMELSEFLKAGGSAKCLVLRLTS